VAPVCCGFPAWFVGLCHDVALVAKSGRSWLRFGILAAYLACLLPSDAFCV
jgi:hypothetical protein